MKRHFAVLLTIIILLQGCSGTPGSPEGPYDGPGPGEITGDEPETPPADDPADEPETPPADDPADEPNIPPEEPPADEPETPASDPAVEEIMSTMTDEEKLWQLIIAAPEDLTGGGAVTDCGELSGALERRPVGGVVLFGANLVDWEQTTALNAGIRQSLRLGPFICVDEEGGAVARVMRALGTTKLEPMYTYRDEGPERARENAGIMGADIAGFGFNVDFAPVADVWSNSENTVIGKRAYSDDPEEAAELVAAAVEGFHDAGMICTLKHFPGHGDTVADSHTGQALVELDREEIYSLQLPPFIAGIDAGADMVMVGHLTVPALDEDIATVSHAIITDILRDELGFQGVVITDSLKMSAAAELYEGGELAVRCMEAGCDILLMPASPEEAVNALLSALESGRLTWERIDQSVRRVLELKLKYSIIE